MRPSLVMTRNEFDAAAKRLFALCEEFNANDSKGLINVQIINIQKSIINTATAFLRFNDSVDVIYCPSYQLPVAYVTKMTTQSRGHGELGDLPTMAKWGFTEHPITGIYCLFWHPCQTDALLKELTLSDDTIINDTDALAIILHWLGIYNNHLSLQLPIRFFSYANAVKYYHYYY